MTERKAYAIVSYAKENGFFDEPIPGFEDVLEEKAEGLITEAYIAQKKGARGEVIKRILWLAEQDDATVIPAESEESRQPSTAGPNEGVSVMDAPPAPPIEGIYEAKMKAIARVQKEGLPIPPEIDEPPSMPRDLTRLSDVAIRCLSSEFNACLARANYLVACEEADEYMTKQLAEYCRARAIRSLSNDDPKKTKVVLEAESAEDEDYDNWHRRSSEHYVQLKIFKALRDTYQGNCDRISREWTMRSEERSVTR